MGEGLPYSMWRVDNHNKWMRTQNAYPAKRKIADYFRKNFYITTSGNFRTQTLIDAMLEIGADRILFSADWPFENIDHAADWFDTGTISEGDRIKIGRDNARALFGLGETTTSICRRAEDIISFNGGKPVSIQSEIDVHEELSGAAIGPFHKRLGAS